MRSSTAEPASPPAPADAPTEELLKKIQELELGHARLKQEMSMFVASPAAQIVAADHRRKQRSQSISPQRVPRRRAVGGDGGLPAPFRHSSPLQRESRNRDALSVGEPSAVKFTDKQYVNILQSMGQSIHIMDINNRLIYWLVRFNCIKISISRQMHIACLFYLFYCSC